MILVEYVSLGDQINISQHGSDDAKNGFRMLKFKFVFEFFISNFYDSPVIMANKLVHCCGNKDKIFDYYKFLLTFSYNNSKEKILFN